MPFAEDTNSRPPTPIPAQELVVPYTAPGAQRTEEDRFPNAAYEWVFNAPEKCPGTTRVIRDGDGGRYLLIILPHPVRFLELTGGKTEVVMAAILHEEVLGTLSTVDGWLSDSVEEAQEQWNDYVEQDGKVPPSWSGDAEPEEN